MKKIKKGFTLAETLITIGIIGIVAALTIPGLMQNYRKHQAEVKLKYTYSILSQALKNAIVENDEMAGWDYGDTGGQLSSDENFSSRDYLTGFFEKYMKPYLKTGKIYGYGTSRQFGHLMYWPNNSLWDWSGVNCYMFSLINGVMIKLFLSTTSDGCEEYNENGSCKTYKNLRYTQIAVYVDINGFDPPNKVASDIFKLDYDYKKDKIYFYAFNSSLSTLKTNCPKGGVNAWYCGALIQKNGWKIPQDYPYKF